MAIGHLLLVLALQTPILLNPILTPGEVRPLTQAQVCATSWRLDRRFVTVAMKKQVAANYGIAWADRGRYEFDHKIPRSLAGADSVANIWMQCCIKDGRIVGPAHDKDVQEQRLNRMVCAGKMSLKAAQYYFKNYQAGAVQ